MFISFDFLYNPISFNNDAEVCREIITQNNKQFLQCLMHITELYYPEKYFCNAKDSTDSNTINLLPYEEVLIPYQTFAEYKGQDPKIYINYKNDTIKITYNNISYGPFLLECVEEDKYIPLGGWPKELGLHGAVKKIDGYIYAKLQYPSKYIVEQLKNSQQTLSLLEQYNKIDQFYTADTDLEKIAIIVKILIDIIYKQQL